MSKSTLASRLISVFPSFVRLGRAVGFTISVFSPFLAPPIVISTFVMASSSVSPAWRASGFIFSEIPRASFSSSANSVSASVASSLLSSSTSAGSFLATSSTSACCSSSTASLSSSDFNVSLFSSAICVVSSVLFSFLSAATVSSILASLLAFSASISSFLETSFVSASSSATGSNFSSDTAGSSFSASTTSSAGASFSASATGVSDTAGASSATSDTEAFACGLSTSFVAADGVSTAFVSSDSDSESLSLVSALVSTLVDSVSLPPSTACAFTTVGDKKMQYPSTQDTNPTDSFLVPYLGLLLADFSFFFSINSFNFSKILPPLIYTIYLLECNKKCKSPKVDKSLLGGFHSYRFYSIPLYSSF